jgi:hypothetical protein
LPLETVSKPSVSILIKVFKEGSLTSDSKSSIKGLRGGPSDQVNIVPVFLGIKLQKSIRADEKSVTDRTRKEAENFIIGAV